MAYLVQTIKTKTYYIGEYENNVAEPVVTTVIRDNKERAIASMEAACSLFEFKSDGCVPKVTTRLLDTELAKVLVSIKFFGNFEVIEEMRITIMES